MKRITGRGCRTARVAGRVAHLTEHRLVQVRHRVDVVGRGEVDLVDLVDDVAEEVAGQHPVVRLLEHGGEHVAGVVAAGARELAEVGEKLAVDEIEQRVAVLARSGRRPSPASGMAPRSRAGSPSVTSRFCSRPSNAFRNSSQAS